jgi:hypothetical protein
MKEVSGKPRPPRIRGMAVRRFAFALTLVLFAVSVSEEAAPIPASPTPENCAKQIHDAVEVASKLIEPSCWHIGPVILGMSPRDVEYALGVADSRTINRAGSFTAFYVFPRDLGERLAEHPLSRGSFSPKTLRIAYAEGKVVAVAMGHSSRVDYTSDPMLISLVLPNLTGARPAGGESTCTNAKSAISSKRITCPLLISSRVGS